jgi:glycosyltransferase involved in cell wall biosynthesis
MALPRVPTNHCDPVICTAALIFPSSVYILCVTLLSIFMFRSKQNSTTTVLPREEIPVTILIPVYEREKYIARALQSALNQTLQDIEIVVVDDRSTDGSSAIIRHFMNQDSRIRLVRHSQNAGTHAARISGVLHARGTYILSLDADDELFPWIAEDAYHFARLHDADLVEFQSLDAANGRIKQFTFLSPPVIQASGDEIMQLFRDQKLNWNLWKRLIRTTVYIKAMNLLPPLFRSKRLIYAEDKLQFGLICLIAKGFFFLKEPGYIYYTDNPENSESGKQQTKDECVRQLRFVERALRYFYMMHRNMTYNIQKDVPGTLVGG